MGTRIKYATTTKYHLLGGVLLEILAFCTFCLCTRESQRQKNMLYNSDVQAIYLSHLALRRIHVCTH
jgi:hypothetical protein